MAYILEDGDLLPIKNHLSKKLPYCKICLIKAITNTIASIDTICPYCYQWDFLSSNESMSSIPPEIKHISNHNDSCKQFVIQKPTLLNYLYLRTMLATVVVQLLNNKINIKDAIPLLKCAGINNELISKVKSFVKEVSNEDIIYRATDNRIQDFIPSSWKYNDCPLNEFYIDPIMHLVFYGTGASTIEEITKYLKLKRQHTEFSKYVTRITDSIIELKLNWCKLLPYNKGTFGGWVVENWIAYLRICKWIYSQIQCLKTDSLYEEPKKPQIRWTMKQNNEWLEARGLTYDGNTLELRNIVK